MKYDQFNCAEVDVLTVYPDYVYWTYSIIGTRVTPLANDAHQALNQTIKTRHRNTVGQDQVSESKTE